MHRHSSPVPCPPGTPFPPISTSPHTHTMGTPQIRLRLSNLWRQPGKGRQSAGPVAPPPAPPQPFPSLAPKQMTSSAGPSSYLLLSLPGTGGGGSLEAEDSRGCGYFGTGWSSVECQPQPSNWKSPDLLLGVPAAQASHAPACSPLSRPAPALFCATLGYEAAATGSHHLARCRRAEGVSVCPSIWKFHSWS